MIKSLHIRNYALIESLEIDFSTGLTIITGETGAGKSILLGALGLIMGDRADTKSLYNEQEKCVVEAFFTIEKYDLRPFFQRHELDYEQELVIRRDISPSGKSRAFINDTPTTLKVLQELSSSLIDLHLQFDTLDIHQASFQLRMVDALAGTKKDLAAYQDSFRAWQAACRQLEGLRARSESTAKEMDFLAFQLEELSQAQLQPDEQERMEEELARLSNAEDIKRVLVSAFRLLCESDLAVVDQLQDLGHSIGGVAKVDASIRRLQERFDGAVVELQDIAGEFEKIAEATEYDPERIQEVQQRLDLLYRLQKKHGVLTVADLLAIQAQLSEQLGSFGDLSADIARLEKETAAQLEALEARAAQLSEQRQAVIPSFASKVEQLLGQLAMPHARLSIEMVPLPSLGPMGRDDLNFMFAANKGSRMQLIKDVASGGELSRLTLVTKSLVANAIPLPTLIFDEIDTGISGDVALKMGNILRQLSNEHQVVSITHSPQIAAKADAHYFVYKKDTPERTLTKVRALNTDERVRAIATMLSQSPPSESALENARELLKL